jgi:hypothetical protein
VTDAEAVWRIESARIVTALTRFTGDLGRELRGNQTFHDSGVNAGTGPVLWLSVLRRMTQTTCCVLTAACVAFLVRTIVLHGDEYDVGRVGGGQ